MPVRFSCSLAGLCQRAQVGNSLSVVQHVLSVARPDQNRQKPQAAAPPEHQRQPRLHPDAFFKSGLPSSLDNHDNAPPVEEHDTLNQNSEPFDLLDADPLTLNTQAPADKQAFEGFYRGPPSPYSEDSAGFEGVADGLFLSGLDLESPFAGLEIDLETAELGENLDGLSLCQDSLPGLTREQSNIGFAEILADAEDVPRSSTFTMPTTPSGGDPLPLASADLFENLQELPDPTAMALDFDAIAQSPLRIPTLNFLTTADIKEAAQAATADLSPHDFSLLLLDDHNLETILHVPDAMDLTDSDCSSSPSFSPTSSPRMQQPEAPIFQASRSRGLARTTPICRQAQSAPPQEEQPRTFAKLSLILPRDEIDFRLKDRAIKSVDEINRFGPHIRELYEANPTFVNLMGGMKGKKLLEGRVKGLACHQCKSSIDPASLAFCITKPGVKGERVKLCRKKYCVKCLSRFYGVEGLPSSRVWFCPACQGLCECSDCRKHRMNGCNRKSRRPAPALSDLGRAPAKRAKLNPKSSRSSLR